MSVGGGARRVPTMTLGLSVLVTVLSLPLILRGDSTREIVLATAVAVFAAYVAVIHPLSIFGALAAVLGFSPYAHLPGTEIPLILVLAVGLWVALMFVPGVELRPGWCEWWVLALAAVALLSVVATGLSVASSIELVAWVAATAVVIPIRFLPTEARETTARTFAVSTAVASVVGMILLIAPSGVMARVLSFTGIDPQRPNVQQVAGSESITTRLNGTYLEANIAGLILAAGFLLALVYFDGRMRVALTVVIGSGLLLTLSRAALATVVVAVVLVALRAGGRRRLRLFWSGVTGAVVGLAIPGVRGRLLDSFGPTDTGTSARWQALQDFPGVMDGHWIWGLGWDRPEFRDAALNRATNLVANAPLATVYRGGVILGALVVVVLLALVVRSWANSRRSFADAVQCCSVIAFVAVALQLDHPVANQPSATVMMSLLVGLSMHRDDRLVPQPRRSGSRPTATDTARG
ncbi:MAG: O-antigen ligase family protein [Aeromicrobium sp.]